MNGIYGLEVEFCGIFFYNNYGRDFENKDVCAILMKTKEET